jgi:protein transport protein SEC13
MVVWPSLTHSSNHAEPCSSRLQHDAVLDYYGKRLATCSSDKTIKIFVIEGDSQRLLDTLRG